MARHQLYPSVDAMLDEFAAGSRVPFEVEDGKSGNALELVESAEYGRLVLKRQSMDLDWIMRATSDRECRSVAIWVDGVLDDAPSVVEHGTLGCSTDGSGWAILMRDFSASLFPPSGIIERADWGQVLQNVTRLHAAFWDSAPIGAACSLTDRYLELSPKTAAREGANDEPIPAAIGEGWEIFGETVDRTVSEPILHILDQPASLDSALTGLGVNTFLHGDTKLGNLGAIGDRSVFLDWQACGWGPPTVELAWFLAINATRLEGTREEVIAYFKDALDAALAAVDLPPIGDDSWKASLDLALLGGLVQLGWNKALDSVHADSGEARDREAADLAWWVERSRPGIVRLFGSR